MVCGTGGTGGIGVSVDGRPATLCTMFHTDLSYRCSTTTGGGSVRSIGDCILHLLESNRKLAEKNRREKIFSFGEK